MKRTIIFILLLAVAFLANNCKKDDAEVSVDPVFENIENDQALDLLNKNLTNSDFVIIDLRTPAEYENCHIKGAINLNYYSDTFKYDLENLDKNNTYVIYCHMGSRSTKVFEMMKTMGFLKVYNLYTGYYGWAQTGNPKSCT